MIINYFTLFIRRQVIFDKYEAQPKNVKSKRSFFLVLYIILSYVFFFVTIDLNKATLRDSNQDQNRKEKIKIVIPKL